MALRCLTCDGAAMSLRPRMSLQFLPSWGLGVLLAASVAAAAAYLGWLSIGRAVRGISHLRRHPRDILLLPLMVAVTILLAVPVKVYAFLTMNQQGWLTRRAGRVGPAGQSSSSLQGHGILS